MKLVLSMLVTGALGVLLPAGAQAQTAPQAPATPQFAPTALGFLSPALVYSNVWGRSPAHGVGAELAYSYHPRAARRLVLGAFTQGQVYTDGSLRFAGGLQTGYGPFGVELGLAHRTGTDDFRASTGLHVAPYLSLGVLSVALRFTVPLNDTQGAPNSGVASLGQGPETALTLGLRIPVRVHGQLPRWHHGCGCPGRAPGR
ncbi:MAG: hypothetical protein HY909_12845 [Deltaproteobacteria bacterium]|nr:hypothetical protein [Deltaproteobacteria bacterium]